MIRKLWAAVPVALSPWQLSQAVVTLNSSSVVMNKFRLNVCGFHTLEVTTPACLGLCGSVKTNYVKLKGFIFVI